MSSLISNVYDLHGNHRALKLINFFDNSNNIHWMLVRVIGQRQVSTNQHFLFSIDNNLNPKVLNSSLKSHTHTAGIFIESNKLISKMQFLCVRRWKCL